MNGVGSVFLNSVTKGSLSIENTFGAIKLKKNGEALMYDYAHVLRVYENSIPEFKGDSLVVGLGLGVLGYNYADKCDSFDYLEIDQDIIDLIKPYYNNFNIIQGDAFKYKTKKKYDCIFIDIHHKLTKNYKQDLLYLYNKYNKILKAGGKIKYLHVDNIKIF